jgi:hypothetical protein
MAVNLRYKMVFLLHFLGGRSNKGASFLPDHRGKLRHLLDKYQSVI